MKADSQALTRIWQLHVWMAIVWLSGSSMHGAEPLNDLGSFGNAGGLSSSSSYQLIDSLGSDLGLGDQLGREAVLENGWLAAVSFSLHSFGGPIIVINKPPEIDPIQDQNVRVGRSSVAVPIVVGDPDTPLAKLRLSASSSNSALVPNANLVFGVDDGESQLVVTRVGKLFGAARITVTVSDGELAATTDFQAIFPEEGFESDRVSIRGTTLEVPFQAVVGRRYTLLASVDLINWVMIKSIIADSGQILLTDPEVLANRQRFYRVIVE